MTGVTRAIRIRIHRNDYDRVTATLFENGISAFEEQSDGSDILTILFYLGSSAAENAKLVAVESDLRTNESMPPLTLSTQDFTDTSWETAWQAGWTCQTVGNQFLIVPSWEADSPSLQKHCSDSTLPRIPIVLDPGMAFGTGAHDTTRMMLELLETQFAKQLFDRVLDVGCGSGILSIAAELLGATQIRAIDNDATAIEVARENVKRNARDCCTIIQESLEDTCGTYDLVLANVISSVLTTHWKTLCACVSKGGRLLISGILVDELDAFLADKSPVPDQILKTGEWCALSFAF